MRVLRRGRRSLGRRIWVSASSIAALVGLLCVQPAHAYFVETHKAITDFAVGRSVNLSYFLQDFGLTSTAYSFLYINEARRMVDEEKVNFEKSTAFDLIAAGSVLEDDPPRWLNHFYDPINNKGFTNPLLPNGAISRDWGWDGAGKTNEWSWLMALDYYERAVTESDPTLRKAYQERLFRALGHVVHLIQDAAQPSHARNDAHVLKNVLEKFGLEKLIPVNFDGSVASAIAATPGEYLNTYFQFFDKAAADAKTLPPGMAPFSNREFFSDDTIFKGYDLPSEETTGRRKDWLQGKLVEFVVSKALFVQTSAVRLAKVERKRREEVFELGSPSDVVAFDYALVLVPRAVAYSEGLINHFFRGRIQASLDLANRNQLQIKNISDASLAKAPATELTLSSGQFRIYYETVAGGLAELSGFSPYALTSPLGVGRSVTLPGDIRAALTGLTSPIVLESNRAGSENRVVVLYRGAIGVEQGVAAAQTTLSPLNLSVALSFDVSGSISAAELDQAKTAAKTLFPILKSGQGNRVAVHSFSSSAHVDQASTADLAVGEKAVDGLKSGGSTALHDAMVLAGVAATAEAGAQTSNRVFIVLFTDGMENASSASEEDAVKAISRVDHPEIVEVYLVFVGDGDGGPHLSDLAAKAGRQYAAVVTFDQLTAQFLSLVQ